ncbi:DUF4861 domain-containing protein [Prolixibacteraceae bacterium JC049]|nr:DUF4861 domain-containing protein [Prolixibacteraceae bacterium JC049]
MQRISFISLFILLLAQLGWAQQVTVQIENTTPFNRGTETVEIAWNQLSKFSPNKIIATDYKGFEIPSQVIYNEQKQPTSFIFQVSLAANEKASYKIKSGQPKKYETKAQSRFVPERLDDYTWENERIAFRTYGPRQKTEGTAVSGIDVWAKRTRNMIIESWYDHMDYHKDHGEGLDFYKVGPTLGSGGAAPLVNGKLVRPGNFAKHNRINNGPIRTEFILSYTAWDVNGQAVSMERKISLDAGTNLSRYSLTWNFKGNPIDIAVGIAKRKELGETLLDETNGVISYAEPVHGNDGQIFDAVIFDQPQRLTLVDAHLAGVVKVKANQTISYWAGAGWNKSGDFSNFNQWNSYIKQVKYNLSHPLKVTLAP